MSVTNENETLFEITVKTEEDEDITQVDLNVIPGGCLDLKEEIKTENHDLEETCVPENSVEENWVEPEIKTESLGNSELEKSNTCSCNAVNCKNKTPLVLNSLLGHNQNDVMATLSQLEKCQCKQQTPETPPVLDPYKCTVCKFKANSEKVIERHMSEHKTEAQEPPQQQYIRQEEGPWRMSEEGPFTYRCPFCKFCTLTKELMSKHYMLHNGPKVRTYRCHECTFQTTRSIMLAKHLKKHEKLRIFKCNLCMFMTERKATLMSHKVIHEIASRKTDYKMASGIF